MKIYKFTLIILISLFGLQRVIIADSEAAPYPWVITSDDNQILFKMVPQKFHWENDDRSLVVDSEAFGVAYKIDDNGDFEELWRVEGWYAFGGEISDDGRYFARYGPWASDQEKFTDLAVAFYDNGELLKEYQVQELIKNTNSLAHSVSHYQWKARVQSQPNGFNYRSHFHLVMIDKTAYRFNYETGEIEDVGIDVNAKSGYEDSEEDQSQKEKKGLEILKQCGFAKNYAEYFDFYFVGAVEGHMKGVHYREPEWESNLRPKKKYPHACIGSISLQIKNGQHINTSVIPQEIDTAFEAALNHPYVKFRFKDSRSTQLVLYIREDSMHKNPLHIQNQYKQIKGVELADENLRDWAEFWITPNSPECTSFFLNIKTKELIYRDRDNYDDPLVLSIAGQDWKEKTREPVN